MIQDETEGGIDQGDTKVLVITPEDLEGATVPPASLSVEVEHEDGTPSTEYQLPDAEESDGVYRIEHTFDVAGPYTIDVLAEGQQGRTERTSTRSESIYVHPTP